MAGREPDEAEAWPMGELIERLQRLARRRIGVRLLVGFGLVALLALLVGLVSLVNVAQVNRLLDESARRDRLAAAGALQLELAVERQSDGVRGFLLSGDDAYLTGFEEGIILFAQAATGLDEAIDDPESRRRLADLRFQESRFRDLAVQQIAIHRQDYRAAAIYLWGTSGRERQVELRASINDYAAWQERVVGEQLRLARRQSALVTVIALVLVGLAGLVSILLALRLTHSITRPIGALARTAAQIKGGALDVAVPVQSEDEIGTLAQTMNQMAASLKESHRVLALSLAETEQRNRELLALNTMAAAAAQSLELTALLATALDTLLELTGVEYGAIQRPDEASGQLTIVLNRGFSEAFLRAVPADLVRQLLEQVLVSGQPAIMDEKTTEPAPLIALMRAEGMRSAVAVPLTSQRRTVGILTLSSRGGRRFEERDIALLSHIGQQLGIAIEHAELLAQHERRITTLSIINQISRAILAELDLDSLYAVIYDQCRRALDIPSFTIALTAEDEGSLLPALVYLDGQRIDGVAHWRRHPPVLANIVARERQPLLTNDYHATVRAHGGSVPEHRPTVRRSWLGVPMTIGERLIGIMVAATPNTNYSAEDADLLAAIANQAAVAVENARLYRQRRELGISEERNRLAREIHDTIAQGLTGLVLQLEATATLFENRPERAAQRLAKATELARSTLAEARRSVWNLRPAPLEEGSLTEAVAALARRLAEAGLDVECHIEGEPTSLPPEVEHGLYRIAQEALENIRKHADAATVDITLSWSARGLTLTVQDDGLGFAPEQLDRPRADGGGFGLLSMRERARLLGGRLELQSAPGEGTSLVVQVPLDGSDRLPRPTQPASSTASRALVP